MLLAMANVHQNNSFVRACPQALVNGPATANTVIVYYWMALPTPYMGLEAKVLFKKS
jgi:hypothetical protein